jgi:hypothetical protein
VPRFPTGAPRKRSSPRSETQGHSNVKSLARTIAEAKDNAVPDIVQVSARVLVDADVLAAAADLLASQAEREAEAFARGRLDGFADGWRYGLEAGAERRSAA